MSFEVRTEGLRMTSSQASRYREQSQGDSFVALRKAGLINENGTLSTGGQSLLLEVLFDRFEDELVEVAESLNGDLQEGRSDEVVR